MRRRLAVFLPIVVAACGGAPSAPAPGGGAATVTITASGVTPVQTTLSPGARVTFVNNDTRSHNMTSDPHPAHDACPEINDVGLLQPGQRRETGNLVLTRTCGFHDHDDPPPTGGTNRWTGSITIR